MNPFLMAAALASAQTKMHRTYGLYPNGDWKRNAVLPEHLAGHVQYNLDMRPGRALIVDGVIRHKGQVPADVLEDFMEQLEQLDAQWSPVKATTPYQ